MSRLNLHVMVLYDLPEKTLGHDKPEYLLQHADRPTERDVCRALKKLGCKLSVCGVFDDSSFVSKAIASLKPDVIFNLCETFHGDRAQEGNIAALIELSGVAMTGSHSDALHLCKDKSITKKILGYDGIRVPKFSRIDVHQKDGFDRVPFPAIVKPLNREASEGIAQASVVYDKSACVDRVSFIHEKLSSAAIIEEFIHGRELYVGVIDSDSGPMALPPRELFMKNLKEDQAMVATFQAKWNDEYRKRWGVSTSKAGPMPKSTLEKLKEDSIHIFKSLGMRGYARIDWRMTKDGEPVFLEANPNPALSADDDFAKAAKAAGIHYPQLIAQIAQAPIDRSKYQDIRAAL